MMLSWKRHLIYTSCFSLSSYIFQVDNPKLTLARFPRENYDKTNTQQIFHDLSALLQNPGTFICTLNVSMSIDPCV